MEQQKQRWYPENGVNGTVPEVGPREWSEWNSSRGVTQRVECVEQQQRWDAESGVEQQKQR